MQPPSPRRVPGPPAPQGVRPQEPLSDDIILQEAAAAKPPLRWASPSSSISFHLLNTRPRGRRRGHGATLRTEGGGSTITIQLNYRQRKAAMLLLISQDEERCPTSSSGRIQILSLTSVSDA
ncbi:hypothetical protein EYF80_062104 [Liparis tanakae]|uniref:Uncharacterized protein n=1 Tax=Liparis tanakae TaxID=230148 RepID=A0A4Z2EG73_9TELE|nr:hypothetical protein EYF80_062104 [Liparis tanakae]